LIVYLDASVVVAALTEERRTEEVRTWFDGNDAEMLAISPWVTTEVSIALSIKVRTGTLKLDERNEAMAA
jgi:predicted nucleic acid-binding protein